MASRPSSGSSEIWGDDTLVEGDNRESRSAEVRCEVEMLCWGSDRRAANVDGQTVASLPFLPWSLRTTRLKQIAQVVEDSQAG